MKYKLMQPKSTVNDVFLLLCVFSRLDVEDISVCGGKLDHQPDTTNLSETGGSELIIAMLNSTGNVSSTLLPLPVKVFCVSKFALPSPVCQ